MCFVFDILFINRLLPCRSALEFSWTIAFTLKKVKSSPVKSPKSEALEQEANDVAIREAVWNDLNALKPLSGFETFEMDTPIEAQWSFNSANKVPYALCSMSIIEILSRQKTCWSSRKLVEKRRIFFTLRYVVCFCLRSCYVETLETERISTNLHVKAAATNRELMGFVFVLTPFSLCYQVPEIRWDARCVRSSERIGAFHPEWKHHINAWNGSHNSYR